MNHPCSKEGIEELLVGQCAPMLLGAKPASLFTFVGSFQAAGTLLSASEGVSSRSTLIDAIQEVQASLDGCNIRIEVLAWRSFGAVLYAHRPEMLESALSDVRARRLLASAGYPHAQKASTDELLAHLKKRFEEERVPHEIGLFLGYPLEDVWGFISNHGEGYLMAGCWKVYANPRAAMRKFSCFKRCTARAERLFRAGVTIGEIAGVGEARYGGALKTA